MIGWFRRRFVRHTVRMVRVLRVLAEAPVPLTSVEVCQRAELPSGSQHRLLAVMYRNGLVVRHWREGGPYGLGTHMWTLTPLGQTAAEQWGAERRR